METIFYRKAIDKYKKYGEIAKVYGVSIANRSKRKETMPTFQSISKKIDVEKDIGYTYEDFCLDYEEELVEYVDKKIIYNIKRRGYTIQEYAEEVGLSYPCITRVAKYGSEALRPQTRMKLEEVLEYEFNESELKGFEVVVMECYCKLYGEKDVLEVFKKKNRITYPVLPVGDRYHLAFNDGPFIAIKKIKNNKD